MLDFTDKVVVCADASGAVETEMLNLYREIEGAVEFDAGTAAVSLQRWANPEKIATAIVFLAPAEALY
ncbi:MAG: hypothetical protein RR332_03725, partial [Clostridiales bacterium]